MKNDSGPLNPAFMGGLGIGLGVAVFLLLISPPFTVGNWCTQGESPLGCFREWSLMFAGWCTVIGGLLAAYLVWGTITKMNEQIDETRKQTREMMGDSDPTLELLTSPWTSSGEFQITNWNRESFHICEIRWHAETKIIGSGTIWRKIEGKPETDASVREDGSLNWRIKIAGRDTVEAAPERYRAHYGYSTAVALNEQELKEMNASLEVVGFLSGANRRKVVLTSSAPLSETRFNFFE